MHQPNESRLLTQRAHIEGLHNGGYTLRGEIATVIEAVFGRYGLNQLTGYAHPIAYTNAREIYG
jgi:hypothetical protein